MTTRVLDWRPKWDEKSDAFRLALFDCYQGGKARASARRKKTVWLNQGDTPGCTGWGFSHVMILTPRSQPMTDADALEMYHAAQREDEWPGEDYEGSSVNGAMRAGRSLGHISAWHWAKTTQEAMHGVSYHGAGELGIWWYDGMFHPDQYGVVRPTGSKAGGHALAYAGYTIADFGNGPNLYHCLDNSWGKDWGVNGSCLISDGDLQLLLSDDGELAFPLKVSK